MDKFLPGKEPGEKKGIKILDSMESAYSNSFVKDADGLDAYKKPGFKILPYVESFIETGMGPVPMVKRELSINDILSALYVRSGFKRGSYLITPGLYGVGKPDENSEVLVTANYKLTFDILRKELKDVDAWILVLDTKGVNVWCGAGKGSFSTKEILLRIKDSKLEKIVGHKRLILPQLGAASVSPWTVKRKSGFQIDYGPVRAKDLPEFLRMGNKADKKMRQVGFTIMDRLILTPVEINIALKPFFITALIIFIISGIGPGFFSIISSIERGGHGVFSLVAGIFSGAFLTPVLLPFIPGRAFALKGMITGFIVFFILNLIFLSGGKLTESIALIIFSSIASSYFAMNFTGATPYTSPSGVEKEMKFFIPVQALGLLFSVVLWIYSAFA